MPPLRPLAFRSRREYLAYLGDHRGLLPVRRGLEDLLARRGFPFSVAASCHLCRRRVDLHVGEEYSWVEGDRRVPNWREQLVCPGCGFNARLRATAHLLEEVVPSPRGSRVYFTEQVTPFFAWMARRFPGALGSEWMGAAIASGSVDSRGIRHEDLTRLSFSEASFDLVVSLDVLEHVPDHRAALAECRRVLAPGGTLLLTCPFDADLERHLVRARLRGDGTIEHLLPPEYHGNPVSSEGSLAYRVFGWELLDELAAAGFRDAQTLDVWSCQYGYLGPYLQAFLAR